MKRSLLTSLFVLTALVGQDATAAEAAADSPADGAEETLLYLAEQRLVVLQFQILVDGQPYRAAWKTFLDEWFQKLDKNQDGELAGEECRALPSGRLLVLMGTGGAEPLGATVRPAPATMKRAAFEKYLDQIGVRAFRVNIQSPPTTSTEYLGFRGSQQDPDLAAKLLFGHLDANADGRLSGEEMASATTALRKCDLDQDETISSAELIPVSLPYYAAPRSGPVQQAQPAFLSLADGTSPRQTVARLTAKYDTQEKDNALSRDELGMAEPLFTAHDVDGNGKWDFEEIQQFLRAPSADVTVTICFGKRAGGAPFISFAHDESLASEVRNDIGSLNLGLVQMEVSANPHAERSDEDDLKQQFQAADADGNGYLDPQEAANRGQGGQIFAELDRDRDDKLFAEEFITALGPVIESAAQRISLSVTDRGRDLFRILDSTGDGRLSVREFRAMAARAALWDRDDDGQITLAETPQQYRLTAQWGLSLPSGEQSTKAVAWGMGDSPRSNVHTGPLWFLRMDRNHDGDVSQREFLGTPEDFQKFDQHADGLITADEARAAASHP
jgi:Ca2+-binding EF-hand superfamily protein